jgi:hypothetical protein
VAHLRSLVQEVQRSRDLMQDALREQLSQVKSKLSSVEGMALQGGWSACWLISMHICHGPIVAPLRMHAACR